MVTFGSIVSGSSGDVLWSFMWRTAGDLHGGLAVLQILFRPDDRTLQAGAAIGGRR